jgi:hypothetical protein
MKTFLIMHALLITLATPLAWAGIGDVYYCHTITHVTITKDGEVSRYKGDTFKFKLTQEEIKFAGGFIDNTLPYKITSLQSSELKGSENINGWADFSAETDYSRLIFDNGTLYWSTLGVSSVGSFVAKCEIFD